MILSIKHQLISHSNIYSGTIISNKQYLKKKINQLLEIIIVKIKVNNINKINIFTNLSEYKYPKYQIQNNS